MDADLRRLLGLGLLDFLGFSGFSATGSSAGRLLPFAGIFFSFLGIGGQDCVSRLLEGLLLDVVCRVLGFGVSAKGF